MFKSLSRFAASSWKYSSNLVLPPICLHCKTLLLEHHMLCPSCWREVHQITPPVCHRLGTPLAQESAISLSAAALVSPPIYNRARAAVHYGGIMARLITAFKFEDRHDPLPFFLQLMHQSGRELLNEADILIPVPLHRLRLLQRRFNQSALLGAGLARKTGIHIQFNSLKRIRRTHPQVGLQQKQRELNVAQAFFVSERAKTKIQGKKLLLIDDVITTGATANACSEVLLNAGAAQVDVLAIALVSPAHSYALFPREAA